MAAVDEVATGLRRLAFAALLCAGCSHASAAERGRQALVRGDYPEARRQLVEATRKAPDDGTLWSDLARAHFRDGALPEARLAIARAIELLGETPGAVLLRAQIRMGQGDRVGARSDAHFVAARAERPRELEEVAILLLRLGDDDAALNAAREAVERSGGEAAAYTNLAVLAVEARRVDVARQAFADGRRRHPDDLPLAEAEAAFLVATGRFAEARTAYRGLLPVHPRPALVHQALALLAHGMGDLPDALEHSRQAVALVGHERADVHYTHVVVLRDLGRIDEAREALRKARRRFPGDEDLQRLERHPQDASDQRTRRR